MNLKLRLASFWMPEFLLIRELDNVSNVTVECLNRLLERYAPEEFRDLKKEKLIMKGNLEDRREIMASAHNVRVKLLITALGCETAVKIGRESLFQVGLKLGREARKRLGVSNSLQDLIRAARILYRVLGIDFRIKESGDEINIMVGKCSLSNYYTAETCRILSAADEGVVQGLNENIHMNFTERMTEGHSECLACIKF